MATPALGGTIGSGIDASLRSREPRASLGSRCTPHQQLLAHAERETLPCTSWIHRLKVVWLFLSFMFMGASVMAWFITDYFTLQLLVTGQGIASALVSLVMFLVSGMLRVMSQLRNEVSQLKATNGELRVNVDRLSDNLTNLEGINGSLQANVNQLHENINELEESNTQLHDNIVCLDKSNKTMQGSLQQFHQVKSELSAALQNYQEENHEFRERNEALMKHVGKLSEVERDFQTLANEHGASLGQAQAILRRQETAVVRQEEATNVQTVLALCQLFRDCDVDGDGKLMGEEARRFAKGLSMLGSLHAKLRQLTGLLDCVQLDFTSLEKALTDVLATTNDNGGGQSPKVTISTDGSVLLNMSNVLQRRRSDKMRNPAKTDGRSFPSLTDQSTLWQSLPF